jgi:pyridoxal phosphate enzyme (YggS family)
MSTIIQQNLATILKQVDQLSQQYGRPKNAVQLLAVSKTRGSDEIRQAYAAGQRHFGENYAQELMEKAQSLADLAIVWHFIGPLQTNKCRLVAEHCQWVHSVWREKEMKILNQHRPAHFPPLNICLQVNIDQEPSKSGVSPEELAQLCQSSQQFPKLKLRGLMIIPKPQTQVDRQREPFHQLYRYYRQLRTQGIALDTLSMGMSSDYPLAIAEGATIIRVGNAIFGARPTKE